jgi:hypothetical protein
MERYVIYKPTRDGNGAATQIEMRYAAERYKKTREHIMVFLASARQIPGAERRFDWENPVTMRLGPAELGEIVAVVEGMKSEAGHEGQIYHQNEKGNKTLSFMHLDDRKAFGLKITSKDTAGNIVQIKHLVSYAEAVVIRELFKAAIPKMFGIDAFLDVEAIRNGQHTTENLRKTG